MLKSRKRKRHPRHARANKKLRAAPLMTKGFRIKPEAARQFDMLKAEVSGNGKDKGPALIAEALNLLFKKYGKSPVA